ncbi:MAG: hypothetical protein JKX80_00180 [Candidatus Pacebacteria bacterium]|nr:hypothetical protein [Candidatus Paceibacterota bacterium]
MTSSFQYPKIVDEVALKLISQFEKNLTSVLLYGSSQKQKQFWDLDIVVILKSKNSLVPDLSFLKKIVAQFSEHTLDLQILYSEEMSSSDTFSLDAHGAFFSEILAKSTVLYGENPFVQFKRAEDLVTISLLNRIQRYVFQARQEYIGTERYVKDKNPKYHSKHLRRMLLDLMLILGPCDNTKQAEVLFKQRFPEVQLGDIDASSDDITDHIELYEQIYSVALNAVNCLLPKERKRVNRASIDGIVFEYLLPVHYTNAIIVTDGLPRTPDLSLFINILASWGYAVFFPRLRGTWESSGEFLEYNPSKDIAMLAHNLKIGIVLDDKKVVVDQVSVLGTSFGGLVALDASLHEDVSHSIAVSPVFSFASIPGIETLSSFINDSFGEAYRYSEKNWNRLVNDDILSLKKITSDSKFNHSKCSIIAGVEDVQIEINELSGLSKKNNIPMYKLPSGHLSFHKNTRQILPLLYKILKEHG